MPVYALINPLGDIVRVTENPAYGMKEQYPDFYRVSVQCTMAEFKALSHGLNIWNPHEFVSLFVQKKGLMCDCSINPTILIDCTLSEFKKIARLS